MDSNRRLPAYETGSLPLTYPASKLLYGHADHVIYIIFCCQKDVPLLLDPVQFL